MPESRTNRSARLAAEDFSPQAHRDQRAPQATDLTARADPSRNAVPFVHHVRRLGRDWLLASLAVSLLFGRQIGMWSAPGNRFVEFWSRADSFALILDILLASVFLVAVSELLRTLRWDRIRRAFRHLYFVIVGSGMMTYVPLFQRKHRIAALCWLLLLAVVWFLHLRRKSRVFRLLTGFCLAFSSLTPILLLTALGWSSFTSPPEHLRFPIAANSALRPVFIFLFDEWSYTHSVSDGRFLPSLPNIRQLAQRSLVFRRAQSESDFTAKSVPKTLYQTTRVSNPGFVYTVEGPSGPMPSSEAPSLFERARDHGYNTALIGWTIPYRQLVGDQVDYCQAYPNVPTAYTFVNKMVRGFAGNILDWVDPITFYGVRQLYVRHEMRESLRLHVRTSHAIGADVRRLIEASPMNIFAFVHWNLPHQPYVFDRDGSVLRVEADARDTRLYEGQLQYVDKLIGEQLAILRASGKYDDALIILCADHAWRYDPDPARRSTPGWAYHVPLIVKWPNATGPQVIDKPFSLTQLGPLIDLAMNGGTEKAARDIIANAPLPELHKRLTLSGPLP